MRLLDLPRTTSFRLALLFLLLFGAASMVLFGLLFAQTSKHLQAQVNEWLRREQASFEQLDPQAYLERLSARTAVDPTLERPFTLFGVGGHRIAGTPIDLAPSLLASLPIGTPFDFETPIEGRPVRFRGLVERNPAGDRLLIAQDLTETAEFDELLINSFLWGGLVTLALGLTGAVIAGTDAVRRIDGVTRATERIVSGDLSQRLPVRGRTGDLDRLSDVINSMLSDIERLMQEIKGVGDNIAHDLRTPLTRLLAGLERAQRRAGTKEDFATAIDEATSEIRSILQTFSSLLRIAEVESGARRAGFAEVDLAAVAVDVLEFYEPMAEEKGVRLELLPATGNRMVLGDRHLLFEAVGNLVENAIKYTSSGGCITVGSNGDDERPGFEVTDTGPGIPQSEREAVLRRFHRLEASRHSAGSGLGLSLVAAVARLHGMEIAIRDAAPGCRITLTWRGEDRLPAPEADPAVNLKTDFNRGRSGD